jgi:tryptophan halogenase
MPTSDVPEISKIVVVGGGTAGWLAACHLAKKLRANQADGVEVHLVESDKIPTIGVGEGTVPAIRESIKYLGLSETEFMRACDASFKQSIKFIDWTHNPGDVVNNAYHHLFDYPNTYDFDATPYWVMGKLAPESYADAVSIQGRICDQGLGPKTMVHKEFDGITSYAYHLDATKFGQLLADHGVKNLGIQRHFHDIVDVDFTESGDVAAIVSSNNERIEADFFVDCTGFRSLILGEKMNVPFIDKSHILFVDKALAAQVPYPPEAPDIPCFTISTAREAGWIWDIGLPSRRGTGYVYSSSHTDCNEAEQTFRRYLGNLAQDAEFRKIDMKIGHRKSFWVRNCASIGLAQGFVEPLEATGLLLFDATSRMLAELMPARKDQLQITAKQYNTILTDTWAKVIDFIKLHYYLSKRDDSAFWIDNRREETVPDSLLENIEKWRNRLPNSYDFTSTNSVFNLDNYRYVLFGMEFYSDIELIKYQFPDAERAKQESQNNKRIAERVMSQLLPHRELLERICTHGLQRI